MTHLTPSTTYAQNPIVAKARQKVWSIILRRYVDPSAPQMCAEVDPAGHALTSDAGHKILHAGVTGDVLEPLGELLELGPTVMASVLGVDRATARRYARDGQPLPKHNAETVLRLAELEALALDVFGSDDNAHAWLKKWHPLLDEAPIEAASTSYGTQRVREILAAIKHGGVV